MKKTNKLIAVLAAMMMTVLVLAGCGGSGGGDVVGEWKITSMEAEGMTVTGEMLSLMGADNMGFTFTSDGKVSASLFDETEEGTWSANGDGIDITFDDETVTAKQDGGKLVIEIEGEKITLERK